MFNILLLCFVLIRALVSTNNILMSSRSLKCTKGHFCTKGQFCTKGHFCTKGYFCTKTLLHGVNFETAYKIVENVYFKYNKNISISKAFLNVIFSNEILIHRKLIAVCKVKSIL